MPRDAHSIYHQICLHAPGKQGTTTSLQTTKLTTPPIQARTPKKPRPTPPTPLQPTSLALRPSLDPPLRPNGLRLLPRNSQGIRIPPPSRPHRQPLRTDPVHDPAGTKLHLDVAVLRHGAAGQRAGRYGPAHWQGYPVDGELAGCGSDGILVDESVFDVVGVCGVFKCWGGVFEWVDVTEKESAIGVDY